MLAKAYGVAVLSGAGSCGGGERGVTGGEPARAVEDPVADDDEGAVVQVVHVVEPMGGFLARYVRGRRTGYWG